MKTRRIRLSHRGFTLMEMMVAMAITTIIVTVLVSITSLALDTWNRSRGELRASRQAKVMIDTMARDFESMVTRRGDTNEWLFAETVATLPGAGGNIASSNASNLIFFTAATDRYDGNIAGKAGDVSCAAYLLDYTDPVAGAASAFKTFVLKRHLVDPNDTYAKLLGKPDTGDGPNLKTAFQSAGYNSNLEGSDKFVCENIYQFTITFYVQVIIPSTAAGVPSVIRNVPVTLGQENAGLTRRSFRIKGSGIVTDATSSEVTTAQLAAGRVTGVEIGVTVLSDFAIDQLRNRALTEAQKPDFLAKNSYQYSKLVRVSTN